MFERFHRVKGTTGRSYEGTGIGLSLIKELVRLHGGTIEIDSTTAKDKSGSIFTVTVPTGKEHLSSKQLTEGDKELEASISNLYIQEAEALIETANPKLNGNGSRSIEHPPVRIAGQMESQFIRKDESILVVDDNADMRSYLKTLLEKNYNVTVARNGKEALGKIHKSPPHLVLSDIMMPVMDGIQLLKEIKQQRNTAHIPVILLSARAGEEAKIEGYEIGADDYLVKPFSSKELLARVRAQIKIVALRNELEGHVRNLFMKAPAIICVLRGREFVFELANEKYLDLVGHRNIIGKPVREALPELEGTGIYEILDEVYLSGKPFIANDRPVTLKPENGSVEELIFNFIYQPSRNVAGEIDGILVYAIDVTEQALARKKIEESEKHLSNIISQVNAGIAQTNTDGKFVEVNERFCQMTGYSKQELLQYHLADITHPDDIEINLNLFKQCIDEGKGYIIEKRYIRKDGSVVWVSMSVTLIEGAGGKKYITGVCIDVSSAKEQEQKIQQLLINEQQHRHQIEESEFRYHNLIDTSTSMILILEGEDLIVRVANEAMMKTIGKGRDIIGKPLLSVIPEIIEQGLADILHDVYQTGKPHYGYEHPVHIIQNDKKELSYYTFVYQAQRDHNGNIEGVAVIATEVTPQAELNKKIRESEQRFRNIVEQAPDPILILKGENMRLEVANEPLLKVWNIDKSSFGKPFLEILPELKDQGFLETLQDVYFNDKILKGEETPAVFTGKNGKKRVLYFNYVYQPYREDDGTISGVLVLATDVTKQVIAQQKIRESEKNYRQLVTHLPVALYTCDAKGHILLYNQAAIQLWGRVPQPGIEKWNGAFRLYTADGSPLPLDEAPMAIALKEGRIEQFEMIIERKDGSRRNVIPFSQLLYGTDGKITGALNMMQDITEEKKAASNNAKLAAIVQSSDDAIISKSTKGIITSWNSSAEKMFGFTAGEMIGQSILKIIPLDRYDEETHILSQLRAGYSIDHFETKRLTKEGNAIDISLTISPIRDKEGKIIGISKIARDITLAKKAESLLRISEKRFRTLTESLPQLIWTADKDGSVDFFSQQWYDYTGSTPEKSLGAGWERYIYPKHVTKVLSSCQYGLETGQPIVVELKLMAKDESYKWFYLIGNPVKDANGDTIKWIGALTDIDKQKKTETILKESEKRFRLLAQSLPQLIWVTDEKGKSEFVSMNWEDYTGIHLQMLDDKWESIVHPDDLEMIMHTWKGSLVACTPYKAEVRLKSKTGEYRWFSAIGEPVFDNENKIIKWVGAFSDIHHLKKEQQRKDAFLSMASHELKTPVTTIKAYGEIAELMLQQKGDEPILAIQRKMSKQVNKLTTLITDLLDNIRVEKGKLIYSETYYDFNDLVNEIVDDMQKINPHFKITYHFEKKARLFGDIDKIGQVINNLITNAIKYSPGTDEIILNMEVQNEGVQLSVQDFGIGIPAEDKPHIFEQFYRVNGDSQSTFPGMGIGLYICSEIINRQGGKIWVESTLGKGSTFYIWLPFDVKLPHGS
jgi:PAS domain S-box-containing protein